MDSGARKADELIRLLRHREELISAEGRGPLLRLEDLSPEEYERVNLDFFSRIKRGEPETLDQIYRTYAEVLHEWGIMCIHPLTYRLYGGIHPASCPIGFDTYRWYECRLCNAAVMNR